MTTIIAEIQEAFLEAKVSPERARAAAQAVAGRGEAVTRADFAELRTEVKGEIAGLRTEVRGEIAQVRSEMGQLKADLYKALLAQTAIIVAAIVALRVFV